MVEGIMGGSRGSSFLDERSRRIKKQKTESSTGIVKEKR
jgi:hypothetical protein